MITISTHVLDTSLGRPAAGVPVILFHVVDEDARHEAGSGVTNDDGRIAELAPADQLRPGVYCLEFDTATYFAERGCEIFYPQVIVHFNAAADVRRLHLPVLLSPFGYTTYRGS